MHVAHPVLLAHPAIERLVLGMSMDVDQPGQYQPILTVDHPLRRPGVIASDKDDRAIAKGDVYIAAVDVTLGALVPGDDPVGILDDGRGHDSGLH